MKNNESQESIRSTSKDGTTSTMIQNPFSLDTTDIARRLKSDLESGLTNEMVQQRLETHGPNLIPKEGPKKKWAILADQLFDPIIYILSIAAVLAFIFSDWLEGLAILVVIAISIAIGFFMELQAVRSLEALRKMGQVMCWVLRGGKIIRVKAAELVPGDIIQLETGDIVPADSRLLEVENLSIKESALTGESIPVLKHVEILRAHTPITDQRNMVFRGTAILTGFGKAIVVATGSDTQLGQIQQMGVEAQKERTPLEKKLSQLSKWLIWLTLVFALLIIVAGYLRGIDLKLMIKTGVALAVAAIPEGLPIVATLALAQGMIRLSKKQVIIKKLEAVQTLGATDIITTDKTGTLTEDQMKVNSIRSSITEVEDLNALSDKELFTARSDSGFRKMIIASILCNNVDLNLDSRQGDALELALLEYVSELGYDPVTIKEQYAEILEVPFDAERKMMATVNAVDDHFTTFSKGAFEPLFNRCNSILIGDELKPIDDHSKWHQIVDEMASKGLRTLAFAYKRSGEIPIQSEVLKNLTFLGVIGFMDPPRKDVRPIMEIYKKAGIKVIMVTGDHPGTARKIAEDVGLLNRDENSEKVVSGIDLDRLGGFDNNRSKQLLDARIFARVTPKQKLDLVKFYQKNKHIVGMIGDGINDVPALKKADIGIAMGIRGTEAARQVADVILKNDRFTAIELAIRQGRVVLQNIRQFVMYLLSCNLAEILSVGAAALLNLPSPLLPLQILFLNLVTDVFPALALGFGKGEKDVMKRPPRNPTEPILDRKDWYLTMVYGLSIGLAVLGIVIYSHTSLQLPSKTINNMAFYTLVVAQLLNVFNIPKRGASFFKNEVTRNPWIWGALLLSLLITFGVYFITPVAKALSLQSLTPFQFTIIGLFALLSIILAQLIKRLIPSGLH